MDEIRDINTTSGYGPRDVNLDAGIEKPVMGTVRGSADVALEETNSWVPGRLDRTRSSLAKYSLSCVVSTSASDSAVKLFLPVSRSFRVVLSACTIRAGNSPGSLPRQDVRDCHSVF
jgi:hypothetical protein